jgi:hypothetical protein
VSENSVARRIFGIKEEEIPEVGKNCTMRNFIIYTLKKKKK